MSFEIYDEFRAQKRAALDAQATAESLEHTGAEPEVLTMAALVDTVTKTIARLYGMKGDPTGQDREAQALAQVVKRMKAIDRRVGRFQGDLDTLRTSFIALGVRYEARSAQAALASLMARIDFVVDNIDAWAKDLTAPQTRSEIALSYDDVQQQLRVLIGAGQAHCLDVFAGLIVSFDLSLLRRLSAADMRQRTQRVSDYIEDCRDTGTAGSHAQTLRRVRGDIARLKRRDEELRRNGRHLIQTEEDNQCRREGARFITRTYCVIRGDIENGYSIGNENEYETVYCRAPAGREASLEAENLEECEACASDATMSVLEHALDPRCPIDLPALNRMHARYKSLRRHEKQFLALNTGLDTISAAMEERLDWYDRYTAS
ncbi:MAG: hypothetical protein AAFZ11_05915 [Pseudomonadota bacterium]